MAPAALLPAAAEVTVAPTVSDDQHGDPAIDWFERPQHRLNTRPITQGTLVRSLLRSGLSTNDAAAALETMATQPRHEFMPDGSAAPDHETSRRSRPSPIDRNQSARPHRRENARRDGSTEA